MRVIAVIAGILLLAASAGLVLRGCLRPVERQAMHTTTKANTIGQGGSSAGLQKATFGAGCFWHVEAGFRAVEGVVETAVGFSGGHTVNPSYHDVCGGDTGHAEVVEVTYDPAKVSYETLLEAFWKMHDPTTRDRQGPDVGAQYRSAIFYHAPEQERAARESKLRMEESGRYRAPIVTEILPAWPFYKAEDYHQQYFEKTGRSCRIL